MSSLQDAQSIFESIADEACLDIDSELDAPRVRLVRADEEGIDNLDSFAHTKLNLGGGGAKFSAGPMKFNLYGTNSFYFPAFQARCKNCKGSNVLILNHSISI